MKLDEEADIVTFFGPKISTNPHTLIMYNENSKRPKDNNYVNYKSVAIDVVQ